MKFGVWPRNPVSVTFSVTLYETLNACHQTVTFQPHVVPSMYPLRREMFPFVSQAGEQFTGPGKCHA